MEYAQYFTKPEKLPASVSWVGHLHTQGQISGYLGLSPANAAVTIIIIIIFLFFAWSMRKTCHDGYALIQYSAGVMVRHSAPPFFFFFAFPSLCYALASFATFRLR
jgi:hypothetical protein